MVTVEELVNLTNKTGKLRVFEGKEQQYIGYMFDLIEYKQELWQRWKHKLVKSFGFHLDIRHKNWKELGLMEPLEPDSIASYQYSDMQEEVYYEIYL